MVQRSVRQDKRALTQTKSVSPPSARALGHIIDPAHLPPLHQSFLHAGQPFNQMSLPIKEYSYPSYDYSKLEFAYVTLLGFNEQVIPHTGAWQPWASATNYMLRIAPVVYWAFQARPLSLFADKPDTTPGHVTILLWLKKDCSTLML
ncbi:hypothetical protein DSO57_1012982 [Entomophthora muscae]|uniref:Uncharacterized protein n=1 Tax=Entomophthora muscae TaxID=34485 RepID=A0ACC2UFK4_9FUNG|nr:hypothetical protein DSO57_1012982 [Entomophthora muscae]